MQAVRIETTIGENGEVCLTKLPFRAGERVEVIVLPGELPPWPLRRAALLAAPTLAGIIRGIAHAAPFTPSFAPAF